MHPPAAPPGELLSPAALHTAAAAPAGGATHTDRKHELTKLGEVRFKFFFEWPSVLTVCNVLRNTTMCQQRHRRRLQAYTWM